MSPKENEKVGETGHNKFQFNVDQSKILSLLYNGDVDSQEQSNVTGLVDSSLYLENLSNFNINFYPFTAALSET